jgi:hypothetical protein
MEGSGAVAPRIFIIWRESGRMRRFCDLALENLFEGVDAIAVLVEDVHKMHSEFRAG